MRHLNTVSLGGRGLFAAALAALLLLAGCGATVVTKPDGTKIELRPPYEFDVTSNTVVVSPGVISASERVIDKGTDKAFDRLQKLAEKANKPQ